MKRDEVLSTIIVLSLACLAGYWLFESRWFLFGAAALLFAGVIGGKIPYTIAFTWNRFGRALGEINSRIILTLAFYAVLTPTALLYRLFNKKSAGDFKEKKPVTYFHDATKDYSRDSFKKLW